MSRKQNPNITEHPCPWCGRKLQQCWIVGGGKPQALAPDLYCGWCDADFPKPENNKPKG